MQFNDGDINKDFDGCYPQTPTDAGICHTFNGRPLDQLLRSSSWFTAFKWDSLQNADENTN